MIKRLHNIKLYLESLKESKGNQNVNICFKFSKTVDGLREIKINRKGM